MEELVINSDAIQGAEGGASWPGVESPGSGSGPAERRLEATFQEALVMPF